MFVIYGHWFADVIVEKARIDASFSFFILYIIFNNFAQFIMARREDLRLAPCLSRKRILSFYGRWTVCMVVLTMFLLNNE